MDVCPNLKCKFVNPIIVLDSLIICMNGKWYKPASGLNSLSNMIKKRTNIETIIVKITSSFLIETLEYKLIKRIKKIKTVLLISLSGKKKLTMKEINEIYINPNKDCSILVVTWFLKYFKLIDFPNIK